MTTPAAVVLGRRGLTRDVVAMLLASRGLDTIDLETIGAHETPVVLVLVDPANEDWATAARLGGGVVVVAATTARPNDMIEYIRRGADAVLDTDASAEDVLDAIETVAAGGVYLTSTQAREVVHRLRGKTVGVPDKPRLTPRESDILRSIERGEAVKQTARALEISEKTVQNIQSRLFRKLGARNRAQAITRAYELGLLSEIVIE